MASSDTTTEKLTAQKKLCSLLEEKHKVGSRIATLRADLGEDIKKAIDNDNLDPVAFGLISRLYKLQKDDSNKAAWVWRHVLAYGDAIGLGDQMDLMDVKSSEPKAPATEADVKEALGEQRDPIEDVLANGGKAALEKFRLGLQDVQDTKRIDVGFQRFKKDYPELETMAAEVVSKRREALGLKSN